MTRFISRLSEIKITWNVYNILGWLVNCNHYGCHTGTVFHRSVTIAMYTRLSCNHAHRYPIQARYFIGPITIARYLIGILNRDIPWSSVSVNSRHTIIPTFVVLYRSITIVRSIYSNRDVPWGSTGISGFIMIAGYGGVDVLNIISNVVNAIWGDISRQAQYKEVDNNILADSEHIPEVIWRKARSV